LRIEGNARSWYDTTIARTILAQKYETTTGDIPAYEVYQRRVALPAGTYTASAEILDLRSNMASSAKRKVTVASYNAAPLSLSGLLVVQKIREDSTGFVITPMIVESIPAEADGYFLFFEAYNSTGSDSFRLRVSYRDEERSFGAPQFFDKQFPAGRSQQWVRLPTAGLARGIFTVELKAFAANDTAHALASTQRTIRFEGTGAGVPLVETELDDRITQLRYVAAQSEIDNIRGGGTLADKQRRYAEFWNRLDPTPGTAANEAMDEYFARITYAVDHFRSYTAGWLTDKGRVYIIYGPPDNITTDPFRNDGRSVETWHYFRRGLNLSFVDESGFGDFRLASPLSPGEKYRYGN
jgi:GWxTD domain-containing protein